MRTFERGGELGRLMAAHDWASSPLGPVEDWSPLLRATVRQLLASKAQLVAFWGPELVALYNDAYAPTIGDKHPSALGRPAREGWAELWDDLEPLLAGLIETRHDHQVFGPERLEEALARSDGRPAETLADELLAASRRFAPGEPIDDTALLVLRAA